MIDERIITAAVVTTGEKSDAQYLQELIEKSKVTCMEVETVIGDTTYSGKDNLLITLLIETAGGDSSGMSETDKSSQTTRCGGDGLSLTPRKASAYSGNQLYIILEYPIFFLKFIGVM